MYIDVKIYNGYINKKTTLCIIINLIKYYIHQGKKTDHTYTHCRKLTLWFHVVLTSNENMSELGERKQKIRALYLRCVYVCVKERAREQGITRGDKFYLVSNGGGWEL